MLGNFRVLTIILTPKLGLQHWKNPGITGKRRGLETSLGCQLPGVSVSRPTWVTELGRRSSPDTVSLAPWLTRTLAMFEATQWKTPLSSARSPVICKTPLGSNVYLLGEGTVDNWHDLKPWRHKPRCGH